MGRELFYHNRAAATGLAPHLSLCKDAPIPRAVQTAGRMLPVPILGGLHHQYVRV
jgi:hypothetical protein